MRRCARATSRRARNFQFHHIPLARIAGRAAAAWQVPASRRARPAATPCATSPPTPWAGVTAGELFDVTPYAGAFARFWLRNPLTQLLPRKFKVAFSADDADVAITWHPRPGLHPAQSRTVCRASRWSAAGGSRSCPARAIVVREFRPARRVPEGERGGHPHLQRRRHAAKEPGDGAHQGAHRPDRGGPLPRDGR